MDLTENKITIIRGEDRVLQLGILEPNGNPYNLTGCSVVVGFPKEDDTFLEASATLVTAAAGTISVTLTDAQTLLFKVGNSMDLQGEVTDGSGLIRKVLWEGNLTVIEETF